MLGVTCKKSYHMRKSSHTKQLIWVIIYRCNGDHCYRVGSNRDSMSCSVGLALNFLPDVSLLFHHLQLPSELGRPLGSFQGETVLMADCVNSLGYLPIPERSEPQQNNQQPSCLRPNFLLLASVIKFLYYFKISQNQR